MDFFKLIKRANSLWILLAMLPVVFSFPVLPCNFYGEIMVNGSYAVPGTNISLSDSNGNICGRTITDEFGKYMVSCRGDDLSTFRDEGPVNGEIVYVFVNGNKIKETQWIEGGFVKLDIVDRIIYNSPDLGEKSAPENSGFYLLLILLFSLMIFFIMVQLRKYGN